jgi:predicted ATPase
LRTAGFSHRIPKTLPDRIQKVPVATQLTRSQFGRHVRTALADLHDPIALRRNPLRKIVVADDTGYAAVALRESLTRAIEALQPGPRAHTSAKAWRPYRVLHLRYVEPRTAVEVERTLALSTSQYYREHQSALEALTTLLFDRASDGHVASLASDSPADAVTHDRQDNLPAQITSFVGREQELAVVNTLLLKTRLLTLAGAGGGGKTRLALEAAMCQLEHFQDGVWLVDLTPLAEAGLLAQTVALTLGISEGPGEAMLSGLARGIGSKKLLVVLDNCEHLIPACAQLIDALLRVCPDLKIMVTSRELVGITGETVFQVPPLSVPDRSQARAADLMAYPAVELFVQRAAAVSPGFCMTDQNADAIVEICSRLDGLPLAIELAAARVNVLSPHQIAERLTDRFRLLTVGSRAAPPHHHTLRALVDWSYELLPPDQQQLFERLAVFAGGWTLQAAETVCGGNGLEDGAVVEMLAALVERSLVVAEPVDNVMRYRMLETLREYAVERLSRGGNAPALYERHAGFYTDLAERLERMLYSHRQLTASQGGQLCANVAMPGGPGRTRARRR